MKICHLCLNGPYNEGWNYQENILPKYHVKNGNQVYQLVTPYMWEGTKLITSPLERYVNQAGVEVIRCRAKKGFIGGTRLNRYPEVKQLLEEINPDVLFIHDIQCLDIMVVVKYLKKNPKCLTYADNHSDFSNSATNWFSKNILHKILWRKMAHLINPYVKKFYGVLPARVDFLVDLYRLPREKCELLVMGSDDELAEEAGRPHSKKNIREVYNIAENDFLIMTGGKIDLFKTQTLLLMKAVSNIKNKNVKLIVFGSIAPELQTQVNELTNENVRYIGWVNAADSYSLFAASDLVVFPGRHSVFWEQVAGQGIPMLVKYWEGTTHVDCGGNVEFLHEDSEKEIQKKIEEIIFTDKYTEMKKAAEISKKQFLYSEIAKKSIEITIEERV